MAGVLDLGLDLSTMHTVLFAPSQLVCAQSSVLIPILEIARLLQNAQLG